MVAYQQFVALSQSSDSAQRCRAAHLVSTAYVKHDGPADERAALYAALLGFLGDTSVKVRASLAYGLLHAKTAPRLVMLSLAKDAPIIARAVVQYSPVLLDVDLLAAARNGGKEIWFALSNRKELSQNMVQEIALCEHEKVVLSFLDRPDILFLPEILETLAKRYAESTPARGKLLKRRELPPMCRLALVDQIRNSLSASRLVKGAIVPRRLDRLMQDCTDAAITRMGEDHALDAKSDFAGRLSEAERLNTRILLHALINGRVLFFSQCVALLAKMPSGKVFTLLESGSRVGLNALFARCAMAPALRNLVARLVIFARTENLAENLSARHFIVTALVEELIIEHDGHIPQELEMAFGYLNEQNMKLARQAALGVMSAFSEQRPTYLQLPEAERIERPHHIRHLNIGQNQLALPAA